MTKAGGGKRALLLQIGQVKDIDSVGRGTSRDLEAKKGERSEGEDRVRTPQVEERLSDE